MCFSVGCGTSWPHVVRFYCSVLLFSVSPGYTAAIFFGSFLLSKKKRKKIERKNETRLFSNRPGDIWFPGWFVSAPSGRERTRRLALWNVISFRDSVSLSLPAQRHAWQPTVGRKWRTPSDSRHFSLFLSGGRRKRIGRCSRRCRRSNRRRRHRFGRKSQRNEVGSKSKTSSLAQETFDVYTLLTSRWRQIRSIRSQTPTPLENHWKGQAQIVIVNRSLDWIDRLDRNGQKEWRAVAVRIKYQISFC